MSVETERFTPVEAAHYKFSIALAGLITAEICGTSLPVYDFGCGSGKYLRYAYIRTRPFDPNGYPVCSGPFLGVEAATELPNQEHDYIIHPLDACTPGLRIGPPGYVICLEVAEHVHEDRLPHLLDNVDRHCEHTLILSWAVRGQRGTRHISCRDESEVLEMMTPRGFELQREATQMWREAAGAELKWFGKSLYLFKRN